MQKDVVKDESSSSSSSSNNDKSPEEKKTTATASSNTTPIDNELEEELKRLEKLNREADEEIIGLIKEIDMIKMNSSATLEIVKRHLIEFKRQNMPWDQIESNLRRQMSNNTPQEIEEMLSKVRELNNEIDREREREKEREERNKK